MASFNEIVRDLGRPRILGLLAVVGIAVAGLWGLVAWGTAPTWVPLFRDLPVESIGEYTRLLGDAGIENRLAMGGTEIQVEEADVAQARVALAQAGIEPAGKPGWTIFDQPSWGMTEFTQRVNYRRALEGELARSIAQMQGISSADVLLGMRESPSLRGGTAPIEASVMLSLATGARPSGELVEAITFLLARSVDGLSSDHVSVVDNTGRVLSAGEEPGLSSAGNSRRQMALQRDLESYLERRAEDLVTPLVGAANVRVRVAAALDYERVQRITQAVDPEVSVLLNEERSEVVPGDPSQGASSTIYNNEFQTNQSTETMERTPGSIQRLTVSVALNEAALGERGPAVLEQVQRLVANAVGLDAQRGDEISVEAMPFEQPTAVPTTPEETGGPAWVAVLLQYQRQIVAALAMIVTLVVAFRALGTLKAAAADLSRRDALPAGDTPDGARLTAGGESAVTARDQLADLLAQRPENASRVLRAWMKDA